MDTRNAPEEQGPRPVRYSFLAELLETSRRNERSLEKVLEKQEDTTAMILSLKEHKTIERVDSMWDTMSKVIFTLRVGIKVFVWIVGVVLAASGGIYATHQVFGWF